MKEPADIPAKSADVPSSNRRHRSGSGTQKKPVKAELSAKSEPEVRELWGDAAAAAEPECTVGTERKSPRLGPTAAAAGTKAAGANGHAARAILDASDLSVKNIIQYFSKTFGSWQDALVTEIRRTKVTFSYDDRERTVNIDDGRDTITGEVVRDFLRWPLDETASGQAALELGAKHATGSSRKRPATAAAAAPAKKPRAAPSGGGAA